MKAERRHELKENVLAKKLAQIPTFGQQYGTKLTIGVILVLLIALVVRYRITSAQERLTRAQESINEAHDDLQNLANVGSMQSMEPGQEDFVAQQRKALFADGIQRAEDALQFASDSHPAIRAQAYIIEGDLNFTMANLPDLPGAATRPSLRPDDSMDTLLSNADDAYRKVLHDYSNQAMQLAASHFGLAAVAENRAALNGTDSGLQWDNAREQYQAVLDSDAGTAFKTLATDRLQQLNKYSQPLLVNVPPLVSTTQPSTQPTTKP